MTPEGSGPEELRESFRRYPRDRSKKSRTTAMHFASDMMNLRHEIDSLRRDRHKMVDRLRRFGTALQSDTAKMLSAMRKAMHEEHSRMREERGTFNAQNQRGIHDMMRGLHAERSRARRNFMGKRG